MEIGKDPIIYLDLSISMVENALRTELEIYRKPTFSVFSYQPRINKLAAINAAINIISSTPPLSIAVEKKTQRTEAISETNGLTLDVRTLIRRSRNLRNPLSESTTEDDLDNTK